MVPHARMLRQLGQQPGIVPRRPRQPRCVCPGCDATQSEVNEGGLVGGLSPGEEAWEEVDRRDVEAETDGEKYRDADRETVVRLTVREENWLRVQPHIALSLSKQTVHSSILS